MKYIVTPNSKHNYPVIPNVLEKRFYAKKEGKDLNDRALIEDVRNEIPD